MTMWRRLLSLFRDDKVQLSTVCMMYWMTRHDRETRG